MIYEANEHNQASSGQIFGKYKTVILEMSMLFCIFSVNILIDLRMLDLSLLIYLLVGLVVFPAVYIFSLFNEKSDLGYYLKGEFKFESEDIVTFLLEVLISFVTFFMLAVLVIDKTHPERTFDLYFKNMTEEKIIVFIFLFIVLLPIFEQFYWRCFLIKSFPTTFAYNICIGIHYGLLMFAFLNRFIEWKMALLSIFLYFLWHIFLTHIRKTQKLITVILLAYTEKIAIFSAFYLMFLQTENYHKIFHHI